MLRVIDHAFLKGRLRSLIVMALEVTTTSSMHSRA